MAVWLFIFPKKIIGMKKKKKTKKVTKDEKPLNPFENRMSYDGGIYTPPKGIPIMTREEAMRELGFLEASVKIQ